MGAITDLLKSERGLLAVAILIAATVLCILQRITVDQWTTFTEWVFGTYVVGKTVTSATAMVSTAKSKQPSADATLGAILSGLASTAMQKTSEPPSVAGTSLGPSAQPAAGGTQFVTPAASGTSTIPSPPPPSPGAKA